MKTIICYISLLVFSGLILPFDSGSTKNPRLPTKNAAQPPAVVKKHEEPAQARGQTWSIIGALTKQLFPVLKNLNSL